jgi:hypothetical protein
MSARTIDLDVLGGVVREADRAGVEIQLMEDGLRLCAIGSSEDLHVRWCQILPGNEASMLESAVAIVGRHSYAGEAPV